MLAKREVASLRKSQATGKFIREITIAARHGGADAASNSRLAAALEKARKESVSRDVIERAIAKGAGTGSDKGTITSRSLAHPPPSWVTAGWCVGAVVRAATARSALQRERCGRD